MAGADSFKLHGQDGWECIADTSAHTNGGKGYRLVKVVNAAVLSAISGTGLTNTAGLVGPTIPALFEFGGKIDSITLSSGVVLAYKR